MTDPNEKMLDDLFARARSVAASPSDDLMARVLADARANVPVRSATPSLWRSALDLIGGWPAAGGLVAATVAGFWIGVAPPLAVDEIAAEWTGTTVAIGLGDDAPLWLSVVATDG